MVISEHTNYCKKDFSEQSEYNTQVGDGDCPKRERQTLERDVNTL